MSSSVSGLAEILGAPTDNGYLCPGCQRGRLQVYHLPPPQGEWVYCGVCSLTGNRCDLLRALDGDTPRTRDRMRELPCAAAWHMQERLRQFWATAREAPTPAALYPACEALCLAPERFPRTYAGVATSEALSKLAHLFDRPGLPGKPGRPWFLTPSYSLPGHIAGFTLLGAGEHGPEHAHKDLLAVETMAFAEGLYSPQGAAVPPLLTPSPLTAWYLHAHNAGRLPLILAADLPRDWAQICPGAFTVWDPERPLRGLRLAAQNDHGLYAELPPGIDFRKREPRALVPYLLARAIPWAAAAAQRLQPLSGAPLREAVAELSLSDLSRSRLQAHAPRLVLKEPGRVNLAGLEVREVPGVGWVNNRDQLIASACIRITEVLSVPGRKTLISGVVVMDGGQTAFQAPASAIDRLGLLEWLSRYLRRDGAGILRYAPGWNTRALQIAYAFSTPAYVTAATHVGWDTSRQVFTLPQGTIHRGGQIVPTRGDFSGPRVPAKDLVFAGEPSGWLVQRLSQTDPAVAAYWATCLSVLAHIAAPIANREPPPLLLLAGPGLDMIQTAARSLGCLTARRRKPIVSPHCFPVFPDAADGGRPARGGLRDVVRIVSRGAAGVLGWQGRHWCLAAPGGGRMDWLDSSAAGVLPALLRKLLATPTWATGGLLDAVTAVARQWLQEEGGAPQGIEAGAELIDTPEKSPVAVHLARVLKHLYRRRYLAKSAAPLSLDIAGLRYALSRRLPHAPADFTSLEAGLREADLLVHAGPKVWTLASAFQEIRNRV